MRANSRERDRDACVGVAGKRFTGWQPSSVSLSRTLGRVVRTVVSQNSNGGIQYAALPWRLRRGTLEVLLITTRRTRRWIVPKGWPIPGLAPADCAAHEATEEAGVLGHVDSQALGWFRYEKSLKSGDMMPCRVQLFALEVVSQQRTWPEKMEREQRWCSFDEAMKRVSEPGLRRLIAKFAKTMRADAGALERQAVP